MIFVLFFAFMIAAAIWLVNVPATYRSGVLMVARATNRIYAYNSKPQKGYHRKSGRLALVVSWRPGVPVRSSFDTMGLSIHFIDLHIKALSIICHNLASSRENSKIMKEFFTLVPIRDGLHQHTYIL
jgi:hypothetical protein